MFAMNETRVIYYYYLPQQETKIKNEIVYIYGCI